MDLKKFRIKKRYLIGFLLILTLIFNSCVILFSFNNYKNSNIEYKDKYEDISNPKTEIYTSNFNNNHSIFGEGDSFRSILSSNTTHEYVGTIDGIISDENRRFDFSVDNFNWNITNNNFTIGNIRANSTDYVVEDYPSGFLPCDIFNMYVFMSIKIPVSCVLNEVDIFVQEINFTAPPQWQILIFNATRNPAEFYVEPDAPISTVSQKIATNMDLDLNQRIAAHWESFPCDNTEGNAILDIENTYRDTHGNGYYFICVIIPRARSMEDLRFIYYNSDEEDDDMGYLYYGIPPNIMPLAGDLCMVADISPINNRPKPSDIGLGIENLFRPDPKVEMIENETTDLAYYIYNTSNEYKMVAQNFTLDQEGILNNISVYLSYNNSNIADNAIFMGLVNDSGYNQPNVTPENPIIDIGINYIFSGGLTDQWITFELFEQPRLSAGKYWWIILSNTTQGENITIKGKGDGVNNNAKALNGTLYGNNTFYWDEINYDYACKIGWHPGLDTIEFEDLEYQSKNFTIEDNSSEECAILKNVSSTLQEYTWVLQNFTVPGKGGILNNISLKLNASHSGIPLNLIIYESNATNNGPDFYNPVVYKLNFALSHINSYTFNFNYSNGLDGGIYWWALLAYTNETQNITVYGVNDSSNGDQALALNGTVSDINPNFKELPVDYTCKIGLQPTPTGQWINDTKLYPDEVDEKNHYGIKTRWMGAISFELNITNTVESLLRTNTEYKYDVYNDSHIFWNTSLDINIPASFRESNLNISKPKDWKVYRILNYSQEYSNYDVSQSNLTIVIFEIENGTWVIQSRSKNYEADIEIYKEEGLNLIPTSEINIFDNITINATIKNQDTGVVKLGIFYPSPNNFTFYQEENALDQFGNSTFDWIPENDPLTIGGIYSIAIEWNNGTEVAFQSTALLILPNPTNLTIINNYSRYPYINDATQRIIVKYNDSVRGTKIDGAIINATIKGFKTKSSLEWDDLYSITQNESNRGLYRIKIDSFGLPINENYYIEIQAKKTGYDQVSVQNIPMRIDPVPVQLNPSVSSITQYISEDINFRCSFKDIFHNIDIDWANIQYKIENTSIEGNMSLAMPAESIYESGNLKLIGENISENKNYKINITASAENCSAASVSIDLNIQAKTKTKIIINQNYPIPSEVLEGQSVMLSVYLINESNDLGMANETIKFSFAGKIQNRIAETDSNGMALIEFGIPPGISTLDIIIEYEGSVESNITRYESPITINIISTMEFIGRILLWIILAVAALVSVVLIYKYAVAKPRKAKRVKKLQKIANKFKDIANLQFIMVIHKGVGMPVFNFPISESEFDPELVGGFFTAIGAFESEIAKKEENVFVSAGFELSYSKYKILVMNGDLIQVALMTETTASENIRNNLREFIQRFEKVYRIELDEFKGNVNVFKAARGLVRDTFNLNLTYPQILTEKGKSILNSILENKSVDLSKLEIAIMKIVESIMKTRDIDYFFIPLVISTAQAARPESDIEIFGAIHNLIQENIFEAVEFK